VSPSLRFAQARLAQDDSLGVVYSSLDLWLGKTGMKGWYERHRHGTQNA